VLAVTVRPTVTEWVALVPVPVTVSVYVPGAAVPALTVSVDAPPAVIDVGSTVAVAPVGTPDTVRFTVCADPFVTAVEIVEVPFAPWRRVKLVGFALIEKSFAGGVTQPGNLNEAILVRQLKAPLAGMYSCV
jgi:hypothetical protein